MDDLIRRVSDLEADMKDVKATLARLEVVLVRVDEQLRSSLPHLATKAELADKPGKAYMWSIIGVLAALVLAAVAVGSTLA